MASSRFAPHGGGPDFEFYEADFDAGHVNHEGEGVFGDLGGAGHEERMASTEVDGIVAFVEVGMEAIADGFEFDAGDFDHTAQPAGQPVAVHDHGALGVVEAAGGIAGPVAPLVSEGQHLVYARVGVELGDDVEAFCPRFGVESKGALVFGDVVFVEDDGPGDDG